MSEVIFERRNDLIYFDEELDKVNITPAGAQLKQSKALLSRDKSNGKKYFQKCITYCFYINHKDSPISHLKKERKKEELKRMNDDMRTFDNSNVYYIAFEKIFIETHYSQKELRYLKLMEEIEEIVDAVVDVPTTIRKKITTSVFVEKLDDTILVDEWINIDNSEAKYNSIKIISALDKLETLLRAKVEQEYKKTRMSRRRLFDQMK